LHIAYHVIYDTFTMNDHGNKDMKGV